jgi:hypothetical protein
MPSLWTPASMRIQTGNPQSSRQSKRVTHQSKLQIMVRFPGINHNQEEGL